MQANLTENICISSVQWNIWLAKSQKYHLHEKTINFPVKSPLKTSLYIWWCCGYPALSKSSSDFYWTIVQLLAANRSEWCASSPSNRTLTSAYRELMDKYYITNKINFTLPNNRAPPPPLILISLSLPIPNLMNACQDQARKHGNQLCLTGTPEQNQSMSRLVDAQIGNCPSSGLSDIWWSFEAAQGRSVSCYTWPASGCYV